jgi:transposase
LPAAGLVFPGKARTVPTIEPGTRDGVDGPQTASMCQNEVVADLKRREPSVEKLIRIGVDTSKSVFQLHGVNAAEHPVLRKKLRRKVFWRFWVAWSRR